MKGYQYEQFVRAVLIKELGWPSDKLRSTRVPGVKFPGGKELKHQIDLLYIDESKIAKYTTIIECKYHKSRKASQGEATKLAQVKYSLRASKAILITNIGFTAGAESVAEAEEIALLIITPYINVDEIDQGLRGDDLFRSIDARIQQNPSGYTLDVKRKIALEPNDRSIDLVSELTSPPTIRHRAVSVPRHSTVQKAAKQVTRDTPAIVRKTMDTFRKK